ncbi:MAG: hypothetical protein JNM59_13145 [Hyphomonadaceae bacterium]|nr:hypothetical protein [Hyphomonadaceae bacterium]
MRARILAVALWFGFALTAQAIPGIPIPEPVYEAPIDRALSNVAEMEGLAPAQREQLLGRLNLLAYARNDAPFTYIRADDRLYPAGSVPCAEIMQHRQSWMPPGQEETPTVSPTDRCARWFFDLAPQREIAGAPEGQANAGARARLEAACRHYDRAVRLDGANLRARLGYAYVLDRQGRLGAARRQLRAIIRIGAPLLTDTLSDWETHAVLGEAIEHLSHIARSSSDRARVSDLEKRLLEHPPAMYVTPIVVPLADAPFARLIDTSSAVAFDFAGTGDRRTQGWLTPDAAWLVWDPSARGVIRSGFDMIGQRTWAVFWADGFEALRALDDNRDGELTGTELGGLALWRDQDGDGVSEPGEVSPAQSHGIAALAVRGRAMRPGLMEAREGVRFDDGRVRPLYDWTPGLGDGPNAPVS